MIFNEDLIFIHSGKTGGASCADYLLRHLQPPVYNCSHDAVDDLKARGTNGIVPVPGVNRHINLAEALALILELRAKSLADFAKVVAVIRHPYTLEYSFYRHLQKPAVRALRRDDARLLELADGDFETFVKEAGYHRKGHRQERFFRLGSDIPSCVELVRFEQLATAFPETVSRYCRDGGGQPFPHHNRTEYQSNIREDLTDKARELIYQKHRFMFDSGLYSTDIQQALDTG